MPQHVTILGDGAMATVCSILLTQGGHAVTMWGAFEESIERLQQNREQARLLPGVRIPPTVHLTANDAQCFRESTMILSAIPTQYIRGVWKRLLPFVPRDLPIVSVAKGIENDTLLRPTQVIADVLNRSTSPVGSALRTNAPSAPREMVRSADPTGAAPSPQSHLCDWPLVALSGPNIAAELARYLPATAVAASADEATARRVQEAFATQWFRVYTNADTIGVELAGAPRTSSPSPPACSTDWRRATTSRRPWSRAAWWKSPAWALPWGRWNRPSMDWPGWGI
jgi:glycerol-3-phosphate dehydrogenase (NAD(P)+)